MATLPLIDAVQTDNLVSLRELIEAGASINEEDEHGWTALNWAAGKGNPATVKLLIDNGADVFKPGCDRRTPYMVALAAGHFEVLDLLQEAETKVDGKGSKRNELKFCRAFRVGRLRQFPDWREDEDSSGLADGRALSNDELVFLHHDYSVTESMWHGENVIFDRVTAAWKEFCRNELDFTVPNEIDLIRSKHQ